MFTQKAISAIAGLLFSATAVFSQSAEYHSIPAAAFDGTRSFQNTSGTAKFFRTLLYAPVNLPHGAIAVSMTCGGTAPFQKNIIFTLRRNQPQQENVDMAMMETSLDGAGFEFVTGNVSTARIIDNQQYNYFIVADVSKSGGNLQGNRELCTPTSNGIDPVSTQCSVGFCSVAYTLQ